ncbi:HAD family acid phosphatase [Acetobacteraceae bacterium KSS8]|uniref:HAD family acid phosphatase n=1 Tax=Endosaccharibacter trunci TaxID=2812733 RepID=A0ABT1W9D5_9PROT|nr:HAD family acid phosphatase [Acetobacteraceae bacterium KSS8]
MRYALACAGLAGFLSAAVPGAALAAQDQAAHVHGDPVQAATVSAAGTPIAPLPPGWSEPENIADAEKRAVAYHDSGRYERDLAAVDQAAGDWIAAQAPHVRKPALVLDIDETSLSNWDEEKANGFGYFADGTCDRLPKGPCGFDAWEMRAQAPAIAPTLALARRAQRLGVAVFFITGRKETVRDATAANLARAGYANWAGLVLEPANSHFASAADFKAPARAAIEKQGYTIVATVGDQRSDLAGGSAMRGFQLPNPFYFIP